MTARPRSLEPANKGRRFKIYQYEGIPGSSDSTCGTTSPATCSTSCRSARARPCSRRSRVGRHDRGGWQVSGLTRFRTGCLPRCGGLEYNANYWLSSLAIITGPVKTGSTLIRMGIQHLCEYECLELLRGRASRAHRDARCRPLASFFNTDMAVTKGFKLPRESQRIQFGRRPSTC